jgi:hypothetical protein
MFQAIKEKAEKQKVGESPATEKSDSIDNVKKNIAQKFLFKKFTGKKKGMQKIEEDTFPVESKKDQD